MSFSYLADDLTTTDVFRGGYSEILVSERDRVGVVPINNTERLCGDSFRARIMCWIGVVCEAYMLIKCEL